METFSNKKGARRATSANRTKAELMKQSLNRTWGRLTGSTILGSLKVLASHGNWNEFTADWQFWQLWQVIRYRIVEQYLFYPSRMFRFQLLQKSFLGLGYGTAEVTASPISRDSPSPKHHRFQVKTTSKLRSMVKHLPKSGEHTKKNFCPVPTVLGVLNENRGGRYAIYHHLPIGCSIG